MPGSRKGFALAVMLLMAAMATGCAPHPTGLEMPSSYQVEAGVPLQLDVKILWTVPHDANEDAIVRNHYRWTMQTAVGHISFSGAEEAIFTESTPPPAR